MCPVRQIRMAIHEWRSRVHPGCNLPTGALPAIQQLTRCTDPLSFPPTLHCILSLSNSFGQISLEPLARKPNNLVLHAGRRLQLLERPRAGFLFECRHPFCYHISLGSKQRTNSVFTNQLCRLCFCSGWEPTLHIWWRVRQVM